MTPQTMNRIIISLKNSGLVERSGHEHHGRILKTALSRLRTEKLLAAHRMAAEVESGVFARIPEGEKQILGTILEKIVKG